jgi:hypothetical protein
MQNYWLFGANNRGALFSRSLLEVVGCCSSAFNSSRHGTLTRCAHAPCCSFSAQGPDPRCSSAAPSIHFVISHHPPLSQSHALRSRSSLFALRPRFRPGPSSCLPRRTRSRSRCHHHLRPRFCRRHRPSSTRPRSRPPLIALPSAVLMGRRARRSSERRRQGRPSGHHEVRQNDRQRQPSRGGVLIPAATRSCWGRTATTSTSTC